jgi:hypothetical protein
MEHEHRAPTYSLVKSAVEPGDFIYVLNAGSNYEPVRVDAVKKTHFETEVGEILFLDHGWLWRCLPQK